MPDWLVLPRPPPVGLSLDGLEGPDSTTITALITAATGRGLVPVVPALSAAAAIASIRAGVVGVVFAAEIALHRLALVEPAEAVLAVIIAGRGPQVAAAYRDLSTVAPLLRPLKRPQPAARPPVEAASCVRRCKAACTVLEASWPALTASLSQWSTALTDPDVLSAEALTRHDQARRLLHLADVPSTLLAALLDPVITEALTATTTGTPLALHGGASLDRFDDLATLSGPLPPARLAELLGW